MAGIGDSGRSPSTGVGMGRRSLVRTFSVPLVAKYLWYMRCAWTFDCADSYTDTLHRLQVSDG